jgi:hypothetical protein
MSLLKEVIGWIRVIIIKLALSKIITNIKTPVIVGGILEVYEENFIIL